MTIELHALRRARVRRETTFATDMTSAGTSFTSFLDVPVIEGTYKVALNTAMEPVAVQQQYVDAHERSLTGLLSWELSFSIPLHSTGVAASTATSSVTSAMGKLLTQVMGAESLGNGSTVASGAATTGAVLTAGQGSRFPAGSAAFFATSSGTVNVAHEIASRSTDTLTWKVATAVATSVGSELYRSATYSLTEPSTDPSSLQFVLEGSELDQRFVLCGGSGSLQLQIEWGKVPMIQFTFKGPYWFQYTGSALAAQSFSNYQPLIVQNSEVQFTTVGSTTRNVLDPCFALTITPNISYLPIKSSGGVQAQYGVRRSRSSPSVVAGSFTVPYQDQTWFTARSTSEDRALYFRSGNTISAGTAGAGTFLITVPTAQIVDVQEVDADGIAAQIVSFQGRIDAGIVGGATNELERSALRIHVW